jgi:predicted negative regulator of RcsB-dependent stress response
MSASSSCLILNPERIGQVFLEARKTDLALAAFKKAAESKKGPAVDSITVMRKHD